jgi:hypothetical protein
MTYSLANRSLGGVVAAFVISLMASACGSSSSGASATDAGGLDAGGGTADAQSQDDAAAVDAAVAPKTWAWVPVGGATCRDGSPTGFGYNMNPGSTKLMVFLEGGGACFNTPTCNGNPAKFGASEFEQQVASGAEGSAGVFDRTDALNPVKDWSFVYIPYCTGDVHGGANPGGTPPGGTPQQFVGYTNVTLDLAQIIPMFPGLDQVLLTGVSAGGFGAALNYDQVATAFGAVPVTLVDDSGPPFSSQYLAPCLMQQWIKLWGFDKSFLATCGADCAGDAGGFDTANFAIDLMSHLGKKYPTRTFGLLDSTADSTISEFFGFGASDCTSFAPLLEGSFTAGLLDVRAQMSFDSHFGSFYFKGSQHTSLVSALDTRNGGGTDGGTAVPLHQWFTQMVAGTATNVGP